MAPKQRVSKPTLSAIESLEGRQFLTATISSAIPDANLLTGAAASTIDLTGRYTDPTIEGTVIDFNTAMGSVRVALTDKTTPKTVANFMAYVNAGRYNNTFIHRAVVGFVAQGGGYTLTTNGPTHIATYAPVVNEFQAGKTTNIRGTIAMAKLGGDPNSATSEWFFNVADNRTNLDNQNGGFTTFGRVLGNGLTTVVDPIVALPNYNAGSPFDTLPLRNYTPGAAITNANLVTLNNLTKIPLLPTSNTSPSVMKLAITNTNTALVTATLTGSKLSLAYAAGKTGTATIGVKITNHDGSVITDSFVVNVSAPASIAGNVFKDLNLNSVKDTTDTNLAGWKAFIDTNKNGVLDTGEKSVATDASGNYSFTNLLPGTYRVRVVVPAGYRLTTPTTGYFDTTLVSGSKMTGKNFGATATAKITGTIFTDANGNKLKDTTETALSGWRIFIDANKNGKFDTGEKSVLSSSTGSWTFDGLAAGTYVFRVVQQTGYSATVPTGGVVSYALAAAQVKTGVLFGQKKVA